MKNRIELLAPGGDVDCIKAAVAAGADAVYCGLSKFNARNRAANISFDQLNGVLRLAHGHGCEVFLTLNIIMVQTDIPVLVAMLNRLVNTSIDGVIVQDPGLFHLVSRKFKSLKVHASTQCTTHNEGQVRFLDRLGARRTNLSRELNISEIRELARVAHRQDMAIEVFVHGSYCISFSGICYLSSVASGNSGNRGRCSQPCRDRYNRTPAGREFPLNLKDNSAYFDLEMLSQAGVDAIKIEGRMKKPHYVYTVTNTWKRQLRGFHEQGQPMDDDADLYKVFNREFSSGYLTGNIGKEMFSDHPRNNSAKLLRQRGEHAGRPSTPGAMSEPYDEIARIKEDVGQIVRQMSIQKPSLTILVSGTAGSPLSLTVTTPNTSFVVHSELHLAPQSSQGRGQHLNHEVLWQRLKAIDDTEYSLERLDLEGLQPGLFVPFKELTSLRKQILFILNGSRSPIEPVEAPALPAPSRMNRQPTLSVLVSSLEDLKVCTGLEAEVHFQLPSHLGILGSEVEAILAHNRKITPWFPSVLVGQDYPAAVSFLERVRPERMVTNNTGMAYQASEAGIPWIAGPYLNIANSLSLICLKETFACQGAFISNELSKHQIKRIQPPADFRLYYSIYHPINLLTSRQCLFHQVTGCEKSSMDDACLGACEKGASIIDLKQNTYLINKTRGNHPALFSEINFLNTKILTDIPDLFSSFLVDLREIRTRTAFGMDKRMVIELFADHLRGGPGSAQALQETIHPTTDAQYRKGI